ncbi:MAG: hypothetical protein ACP5GY_04045 [Vulcanisaeta sp.]
MIKAVKAQQVDYVELETAFTAICPVDNTIDNYIIKVRYRPRCDNDGCAYIELGSFRDYLDGFKGRAIYHEDVANEIINEIMKSIRPVELSITLISNYRGIKYVLERKINM